MCRALVEIFYFFFLKEGNPHSHVCQEAFSRLELECGGGGGTHYQNRPAGNVSCNLWE